MAEQMEITPLNDILGGSKPDGSPRENDPVARQQAERNTEVKVPVETEPVAKEPVAAAEPTVERSTSRRKQHQQKERDTREAAEGRVRDENGRYVAKETLEAKPAEATPATSAPAASATEPATATPAAAQPANNQEFTPKERAFLAAAQEERRKRQAMEQELAALRQNKPAEPAKTFWDDPEAALKQHETQTRQIVLQTRLDTSEAIARQRYPDFDANVEEFGTLMQTVPGVRDQWLAAADPAEFAYQVGKRQKELKSIGNIEEYRQRVASEERAKIEAEFKAKEADRQKLAADLPGSLSDVRSTSTPARAVFTGPTPLDAILRG